MTQLPVSIGLRVELDPRDAAPWCTVSQDTPYEKRGTPTVQLFAHASDAGGNVCAFSVFIFPRGWLASRLPYPTFTLTLSLPLPRLPGVLCSCGALSTVFLPACLTLPLALTLALTVPLPRWPSVLCSCGTTSTSLPSGFCRCSTLTRCCR